MKQLPLFPLVILLILTGTICVRPTSGQNTLMYVAHRGASYLAPENTLASIELAWALGADAAECDVMLTADRRVILFHDKNTRKLTGTDLDIASADWNELSRLTIKSRETHLPEYGDEPIPLLEEVLATIPEDRMLVIEIKTGTEIMPYLEKTIRNHWKRGRISFISFNLDAIRAAHEAFPDVPCFYLSMFRHDLNKQFSTILEAGLDGVDLRYRMINNSLMEKCRAAGLEVWCWTVNDPDTATKMKELGVTALTTDRPAWLKKQAEAKSGS